MDGSWAALVELVFSFGVLVAFIHWQFWELDQRAKAREAEKRAQEKAASGEQGESGS
ncbi:MAG: hypothetical protein U1E62_25940 [Alsobacter sp.]